MRCKDCKYWKPEEITYEEIISALRLWSWSDDWNSRIPPRYCKCNVCGFKVMNNKESRIVQGKIDYERIEEHIIKEHRDMLDKSRNTRLGKCTNNVFQYHDPGVLKNDLTDTFGKIFYMDGEEYGATYWIDQDFGCIYFEKKGEKEMEVGLSIEDIKKISKEFCANSNNFIHETFKHGEDVRIGRFCIIEKDCEVGDCVELMDYVKLMPGTKIGNNCKLDDYVNTSGYCEIGNNVRIKRCSMIGQATRIHDNVRIMSHITTVRMRRPTTEKKEEWIEIGENAVIGSHSCLMAGIIIGKFSIIGMGSVVVKDTVPFGIYVGNPARRIGWNRKE